MQKIKTIFIGTGSFAIPIFEALLCSDLIVLVSLITQPDRPSGRKQLLAKSEVKSRAEEIGFGGTILAPENLRTDAKNIINRFKPELVVVADYGQLVPEDMLNAPRFKCLNVHGSLLPKLRGAVPIPLAILQGLSNTGITIQVMSPGLDDGPVIAQIETPVSSHDTSLSLKSRLADLGARELLRILPDWLSGKINPVHQNHDQATYCYQKDIAKEKAEIKPGTDIELAERMVRAYDPWPVAWCMLDNQAIVDDKAARSVNKRLKIYKARIAEKKHEDSDKLIIERIGKRLFLQLNNGSLELLELQLEGKRRLPASEYLFLAN